MFRPASARWLFSRLPVFRPAGGLLALPACLPALPACLACLRPPSPAVPGLVWPLAPPPPAGSCRLSVRVSVFAWARYVLLSYTALLLAGVSAAFAFKNQGGIRPFVLYCMACQSKISLRRLKWFHQELLVQSVTCPIMGGYFQPQIEAFLPINGN